MSIVSLILAALAVWRMSNMLADFDQEGPGRILVKLRYLAGVRYNENSVPYPKTNLAQGLTCVYCNSVWIGAVFGLMLYSVPEFTLWFSLPLAFSAVAIILERLVKL